MEIKINDLSKTYGKTKALSHFSVTLNEGIYGILGPNGAGKSTLINLITDNVKRETGEILCDGEDILELGGRFRRTIGYMPQQQGFYDQFSARAFLKYMAGIKGIPAKDVNAQIDELLETVNLTDVAHKRIGGFSGGMKQRVLLAQALLGSPKLLILDEPTAGLDPKERINIRNFIAAQSKKRIILFATHVVSDIECIADEILLMKKGELVKKDTPANLIKSLYGKVGEIHCPIEEVESWSNKFRTGNLTQREDGVSLRIVGDELPAEAVDVREQINLEDVYMYYLSE